MKVAITQKDLFGYPGPQMADVGEVKTFQVVAGQVYFQVVFPNHDGIWLLTPEDCISPVLPGYLEPDYPDEAFAQWARTTGKMIGTD